MALMNNFLGFSEPEEQRTDGIYGIVPGGYEGQETYPQDSDEYAEETKSMLYHKGSNQDLLNVYDPDEEEEDGGLDIQKLYNRYAKKQVTFSSNNLEFKYEDVPPIINEQPDPITLTNYRKKSRSQSKSRSHSSKRSLSAKRSAQKKKMNRAKKSNWKARKGSSYKIKNKQKRMADNKPQWTTNTLTTGFFGNLKDIKSTRLLEDAPTINRGSGMKVLQEHQGAGKFFIDFLNEKGQKTGNLKIHKDIASLNEEYENRQFQSMQIGTDNFMKRKTGKKTPKSRSHSKPKQRSITRQERETNTALGAAYGAKSNERKLMDSTKIVEKQVQQNFKEKENLINMLSQELEEERNRRKLMDKEFKNQFSQFEEELKKVQNQGEKARSRPTANNIGAESLDYIPTRDGHIPKKKPHIVKTFKPTPYKSTFGKPNLHNSKYKNIKSKMKEQMKMPDSYKQLKLEKMTKELLKKDTTPKKPVKQTIDYSSEKTPKRSPAKSSRSTASTIKKKSSLANIAMSKIHQNEIQRQLQLDVEREVAIEVLGKYKQNPNLEMHKVQ